MGRARATPKQRKTTHKVTRSRGRPRADFNTSKDATSPSSRSRDTLVADLTQSIMDNVKSLVRQQLNQALASYPGIIASQRPGTSQCQAPTSTDDNVHPMAMGIPPIPEVTSTKQRPDFPGGLQHGRGLSGNPGQSVAESEHGPGSASSTLLGVANNLPSSSASSVPTDVGLAAQPGIRTLGNTGTFSGRMGEMPPMSSQLPLGYGVSEVTRNKIWTNQYVEFFDLLYPSKSTDLVMGFRKNTDSTDIIVKSDKAKKIKTIHEWNSAFSIFVAIYTQKFPQEISHLLKHGEHVRQLERDGANWLYYDEEFRRLHQAENVGWHVFQQELVYAAHHSQKHQISVISGGIQQFSSLRPYSPPQPGHLPTGLLFQVFGRASLQWMQSLAPMFPVQRRPPLCRLSPY